MTSHLRTAICCLILATISSHAAAEPFDPHSVIVVRLGDGAEVNGTETVPVALDEYLRAGALVQSIRLPDAASGDNHALTLKRNRVAGGLSRSVDGRYLVMGGSSQAPRVAVAAGGSIARTIARVDARGQVDTSTQLSDAYDSSEEVGVRSVVSVDGSAYWVSGKGTKNEGVRYLGHRAATSVCITNPAVHTLHLAIAGGRLILAQQDGLFTVGQGLPTTGDAPPYQPLVRLEGIPQSNWRSPSPVFLDLDQGIEGVDTLYLNGSGQSAIVKYCFDGKSWREDDLFKVQGLASVLFLTGTVDDGQVVLYGTTDSGSAGSFTNELVEIRDASAATQAKVLAKAGQHESFRGVALAPIKRP